MSARAARRKNGRLGPYVKFRGQLGPLCQILALLRCLSKNGGASGPYYPPLWTLRYMGDASPSASHKKGVHITHSHCAANQACSVCRRVRGKRWRRVLARARTCCRCHTSACRRAAWLRLHPGTRHPLHETRATHLMSISACTHRHVPGATAPLARLRGGGCDLRGRLAHRAHPMPPTGSREGRGGHRVSMHCLGIYDGMEHTQHARTTSTSHADQ